MLEAGGYQKFKASYLVSLGPFVRYQEISGWARRTGQVLRFLQRLDV